MKNVIKLLIMGLLFLGCSQTKQSIIKESPMKIEKKEENNQFIPISIEVPKIKIENEVKSNFLSDKLVIVYPSVTIGKYALEATNSASTYLINRNKGFDLITYDLVVQNKNTFKKMISKIKEEKVNKVIAMITKENLHFLLQHEDAKKIQFYFPLINNNDVKNIELYKDWNMTFGAISYQEQFKKIISYKNNKRLVEFYDNSGIGRTLHQYLNNQKIVYSKKVNDNNGNYKYFLKNNRKLNNSLVFLNTPIVKSSILLSAINTEELTIDTIASTQLNYTPLLFSLTQKHDRKKLIVASSIGKIPKELEEYNQLIGNNLNYSWVNYSVIIGVEYLLSNNINLFPDLSIENQQIVFPVKLYKVGKNSFQLLQ